MKIKSIIAYAVVRKPKCKMSALQIYDTDEIEILKDEEIIKVEIKQWKK